MENEGGAQLVMEDTKLESSQASDLASLNRSGLESLGLYCHNNNSEESRQENHGTTSEPEQAKPRSESQISNFPDEWSGLEVSYSDIKDATNNFSESSKIGKGGFGNVHLGKLGGRLVAIKILDSTSTQGQREFFHEIEVLCKMRHPNLVKLVGACFEARGLVYEYLPNGSLQDCLQENPDILTWKMRTRIIYEISLALIYLHSKSVVHGDLKPANVLLDANFKSKISDFGLCRFLPEDMTTDPFLETTPMGTPGYMDPWFFERCILRPGSDLYSFGITILKLLTGMSPIGLAWKISQTDENSLQKMIDTTAGSWPFELVKEMVYWSLQCCYHNEKSSKLLMDMSTCLKDMLEEIENLEGGRFKRRQSTGFGSRGLEPPSHNKDNEKIKGATNRPWPSFLEPLGSTQDVLKGPEPPTDNKEIQETISEEENGKSSTISDESEVDESDDDADGKLIQFDGPHVFTVEDLLAATAEIMGEGTYGTMYKATLEDGNQVAVTRLRKKFAKGQKQFESEVNILGMIRHANLLALRCYHSGTKGERLLVFDFMPKGNVATFLHAREIHTPIDWPTRMNIAIGTARGLNYLHNNMNIIHGNLTSSSILLDDNIDAKISDYDLSHLGTAAANSNMIITAGAFGYQAPELARRKKANSKTDVYSLGVILLELLTGRSPMKSVNGVDLPQWVASMVKDERTAEVFDLELMSDAEGATRVELLNTLKLAFHCVNPLPAARPDVQQVLQQLEEIKPEPIGASATRTVEEGTSASASASAAAAMAPRSMVQQVLKQLKEIKTELSSGSAASTNEEGTAAAAADTSTSSSICNS